MATTSRFFEACEDGDLEAFRRLLENGAEIDCEDEDPSSETFSMTPLQVAVEAGHGRLVLELLARGADLLNESEESEDYFHTVIKNDWKLLEGFFGDLGDRALFHSPRLDFSCFGALEDDFVDAVCEAVAANPSIREISFSNNTLSAQGAEAILAALKTNGTITSLDLVDNFVPDVDPGILRDCLAFNTSLRSLDLSMVGLDDECMRVISEALLMNSTLTCLSISRNGFGDEGVKAIAAALLVNTSLSTLDLNTNEFSDVGALALFSALETNRSLTSLDVSMCQLGDDAISALATKTLVVNTTLSTLFITENSFRGISWHHISNLVRTTSTLTKLDMSFNTFRPGFVTRAHTHFLEALTVNRSLLWVSLGFCAISDGAGQAIADLIRGNETLTMLDIANHHPFSEASTLAIASAMATNFSLCALSANEWGWGMGKLITDVITANREADELRDDAKPRVCSLVSAVHALPEVVKEVGSRAKRAFVLPRVYGDPSFFASRQRLSEAVQAATQARAQQ